MVFGDLLISFRGLEQEMKTIQKEDTTFTDGYASPTESYEKTFRGILVDHTMTEAEIQGWRDKAERLLYVRLSQDWVPDLEQDDIVIDANGDKWKIVGRYNYEEYGNCKVFGVARVEHHG